MGIALVAVAVNQVAVVFAATFVDLFVLPCSIAAGCVDICVGACWCRSIVIFVVGARVARMASIRVNDLIAISVLGG